MDGKGSDSWGIDALMAMKTMKNQLMHESTTYSWTDSYSGYGKLVDAYPLQVWSYPSAELALTPKPPRDDQCPHCYRPWHPGPLTKAVSTMLVNHEFDPKYDPDKDETPIVCIGAEYQGPLRGYVSHNPTHGSIQGSTVYADYIKKIQVWMDEAFKWFTPGISPYYYKEHFAPEPVFMVEPKKAEVNGEIVKFGEYPVEKVDQYTIKQHVASIQSVADQFGVMVELPDMKADYQSIIDKFNQEKTCGPQSSSVKH